MIAVAAFVLTRVGINPKGTVPPLHYVFYSLAWLVGVVGVLLAMWGVVHSRVEKHWCPDPDAHVLERPTPVTQPASGPRQLFQTPAAASPRAGGQLLSVLRQLSQDLRTDRELLEGALSANRYWPTRGGGQLRDRAWRKNRDALAETAAITTGAFQHLTDAFGHVRRINGFLGPRRWWNDSKPKDGDRLAEALNAVAAAEADVERILEPPREGQP